MCPCPCSFSRMAMTSLPPWLSSAPVGSSARITGPPFISARAMLTRCCWPPESWLGWCCSRSPSPRSRSRSLACASRCGFRHAAVHGGNFRVLDGAQIGHQVVALEDETEGIAPQCRQRIAVEAGDVDAADAIGADRRLVETADDVHQRGLARAGCAHDGDEFAALNHQADVREHGQRLAARRIGAADRIQFEQRRRHQGPFRAVSGAFRGAARCRDSPDHHLFLLLETRR